MFTRRLFTLCAIGAGAWGQQAPVDFICPMDPDVRSKGPGKCPRCGMKLEAGLPEPVEYPVKFWFEPTVPRPGLATQLHLEVVHPSQKKRVREFEEVHEKLFHLFAISSDLNSFAHVHPQLNADGTFTLNHTFTQPGEYRMLADFYPKGGTPQLVSRTFFIAGERKPAPKLLVDMQPKEGENLHVELVTEPPQPIAGKKTLLFFRISPHQGLQPYLGAWGHLLAASGDLIDLIHGHPEFPEAGPQIQFNVIFPRAGVHRVWVQFQSLQVVNTVAFNVQVVDLR